MIAVLNDGAILSIAYDNVHYRDKPEAWNMRLVLGISTVLGLIGVVAAFGLFYLGERVFHLDHARIQTLMYLKLSVAGHLTIFLTRTRGPFWSIRPARILWVAVLGTQIVATLIAVYGLFMSPLGWGWAGFVWGYALIWFLVNDRVKLLAYRIFGSAKVEAKPEARPEAKTEPETKAEPKPEAKVELKPDAKAEPTPEVKAEPKPEVKTDLKPEAKPKPETTTPSDSTPQIAKRAYELYEERGRNGNLAAQDWAQAKREIGTDGSKAEPKPEATVEPKPEVKAESKDEVDSIPEVSAGLKPESNDESKPQAKAESDGEAKTDAKPKAEAEPNRDLTPQLVKRVHELYEELGREEVREVEKLEKPEKSEQEIRKDGANK
jgi:H+-transporting ATPase